MESRTRLSENERVGERPVASFERHCAKHLAEQRVVVEESANRRGAEVIKQDSNFERRRLAPAHRSPRSPLVGACQPDFSFSFVNTPARVSVETESLSTRLTGSVSSDGGPHCRRRRRDACKALIKRFLRRVEQGKEVNALPVQQRSPLQLPSGAGFSRQGVSETSDTTRVNFPTFDDRASRSQQTSLAFRESQCDVKIAKPISEEFQSEAPARPLSDPAPSCVEPSGSGAGSAAADAATCAPAEPGGDPRRGAVCAASPPRLRTLQLQSTEERLPAPQLRLAAVKPQLDGNGTANSDEWPLVDETAAAEATRNGLFSYLFDAQPPQLPQRRIKMLNTLKKPLDQFIERLTDKLSAATEEELSPRVGYKLCTSSVPKGPVGPRSLMERYRNHTYLPELQGKEGEDNQRRLFRARREQRNRQRAKTFFGMFQTFKTGDETGSSHWLEDDPETFDTSGADHLGAADTSSDSSSSDSHDVEEEEEGVGDVRRDSAMSSTFSSTRTSVITICASPLASFHRGSSVVDVAERRASSLAPIDLLAKALHTLSPLGDPAQSRAAGKRAAADLSRGGLPAKTSASSSARLEAEDKTWAATLLPFLLVPPFLRERTGSAQRASTAATSNAISRDTSVFAEQLLQDEEASEVSSDFDPYSDSEDMLLFPSVPPTALQYADVFI